MIIFLTTLIGWDRIFRVKFRGKQQQQQKPTQSSFDFFPGKILDHLQYITVSLLFGCVC